VVGYKDIDKRNLALCRRQLTWGMFFSNICSLISGPCMTMVGFAQHLGRRQVSLGMDANLGITTPCYVEWTGRVGLIDKGLAGEDPSAGSICQSPTGNLGTLVVENDDDNGVILTKTGKK